MARVVVITSKHDLGVEGAKQRVIDRFAVLKTTYMDRIGGADLTWNGNTGHAWVSSLGQRGTAILHVDATHLKIEIQLPWLLAGLAGLVESIIRSNADALHPAVVESPRRAA